MTKGVALPEQHVGMNLVNAPLAEKERPSELLAQLKSAVFQISEMGLSGNEQELLSEVILSVNAIRFGTIVLTIHEGHLVEVSKTVRLRGGPVGSGRRKEGKTKPKDD